jgi:rhamnose transport system permease protein
MTAVPQYHPALSRREAGGFLTRHLREVSVAAAYALILALLAIIRPEFFQTRFRLTWISAAPVIVLAVGMTLVILARHIDISIGSQFSVCGVVAGLLAARGMPMAVVLLGTVLAGAAMGAVNGLLVAGLGWPSIVVTLATMVILRGSLMWATDGAAVQFPAGFQWFGLSQQAGQAIVVIAAIVIFAAFAWAMRWLAAGRAVYAVGSDREAARLAGIRPRHVVFGVFVLMGALAGLAALLSAVQFALVLPNAGEGLELEVIAAVVVGGTAISGGRGTLIGTLLGVALLAVIPVAPAFLLSSRPELAQKLPQWAMAIQGAIILLAVASDALARRAD